MDEESGTLPIQNNPPQVPHLPFLQCHGTLEVMEE